MGRVTKGKKTAGSNEVVAEKVEESKMTPKKQAISDNISENVSNGEAPAVNGDSNVKTKSKATKSAKEKKESKIETKNSKPKTNGNEKLDTEQNDLESNKVNQVVPETKKRATKKKPEENSELETTEKKRNKKEISNGSSDGQEIADGQSTEETKSESPKKRGRNVAGKSDDKQKTDVIEPANKRAKKVVQKDEKTAEKKPVRGKKAEEPKPISETKTKGKSSKKDVNVQDSEVKETVSKKGSASKKNDLPGTEEVEQQIPKKAKGKASKKDDKIEEIAVENSVADEPVAKKSKGRVAAKKDDKPEISEEKPSASVKAKGKAAKNDENTEVKQPFLKKGKGKTVKSDEQADSTEVKEPAPKKARGKITKSDESEEIEQNSEVTEPAAKKSKGRVVAKKADAKPAEGKKLQNSIQSDFSIDFDIKEKWNLKLTMWNTSGLRSCVDKGCVDYFKHEKPDIICLNEIKCGTEEEIPEQVKLEGYHPYWNIAKGQPGVGILSKQMPIDVFYDIPNSQFSEEKRLITAEYKKFYLVCCYVVNAGRGLKTLDKRLEWNKAFDDYIKELDKKKPVIIAGDMNVAHSEIDLANPKTNKKNAGFTIEERDGFTQLLSYGFVDTFRKFYPDQTGAYTFWSYMNNARAKNVGWRLDYFIASERLMDNVKDNVIRSTIKGSDHCPIVLFLDL